MSKAVVLSVLIAVGIIALRVTGALAFAAEAVAHWRTGAAPLPELVYAASWHDAAKPARSWVDADAACGTGTHGDRDGRLALRSLATASGIEIVGVSTAFGPAGALRVAQQAGLPTAPTATAQALYCDVVKIDVGTLFRQRRKETSQQRVRQPFTSGVAP